MGQGNSKEETGLKEGRAPWQILVSSSRTSTSSYDSWDSYPASIQTHSRSDLKPREGATVISRLSQAFDYIKKKFTRKESHPNDKKSRGGSNASKATDNQPRNPVMPLEELVSCTEFSREELQQMYRGFKNDFPYGAVDQETFRQICSKLFPRGDCTMYATFMFSTFDKNNDGKITFEDFVFGLSESIHGSMDAKLRSLFRIFDVERDGVVTREELSKVFVALYKMTGPDFIEDAHSSCGMQIIEEHVDELFKALDRNSDGFVTEENFIEACLFDKSLLRSLAAANQFDNMQEMLDEDCARISRTSSSTSSLSPADSVSINLSPTLLCRSFNCNISIPSIVEYRQRPDNRVCDVELSEIRQKRSRCSTSQHDRLCPLNSLTLLTDGTLAAPAPSIFLGRHHWNRGKREMTARPQLIIHHSSKELVIFLKVSKRGKTQFPTSQKHFKLFGLSGTLGSQYFA